MTRAAVELAKLWRTDKYLRKLDVSLIASACFATQIGSGLSTAELHDNRLQAVMVVADAKQSLTITGNGDVLEPHDGIIGICKHDAHMTLCQS